MTVVSFYSYKGGVGRSILLANTAVLLAKMGYNVVCVDFDLDAGGLHKIFNINEEEINSTTLSVLAGREMDLINLDNELNIAHGHLYVLPNISNEEDLNAVLNRPDGIGGGYIGTRLRDILFSINNNRKINPTFILIDTRSGLSEIFSKTVVESNILILVLKPNKQNIEGGRTILEYTDFHQDISRLVVFSQIFPEKEYLEKLKRMKKDLLIKGNEERHKEINFEEILFDKNLLYEEFIPAIEYKDFERREEMKGYINIANWILAQVGLTKRGD